MRIKYESNDLKQLHLDEVISADGELYYICKVNGMYLAISLADAVNFNDPLDDLDTLLEHLLEAFDVVKKVDVTLEINDD